MSRWHRKVAGMMVPAGGPAHPGIWMQDDFDGTGLVDSNRIILPTNNIPGATWADGSNLLTVGRSAGLAESTDTNGYGTGIYYAYENEPVKAFFQLWANATTTTSYVQAQCGTPGVNRVFAHNNNVQITVGGVLKHDGPISGFYGNSSTVMIIQGVSLTSILFKYGPGLASSLYYEEPTGTDQMGGRILISISSSNGGKVYGQRIIVESYDG